MSGLRRLGAVLILLAATLAPARAAIRFREVAGKWGIDFRHHNGASGRRYMPETMVGGVVLFDYDGDGDVDVFFVDGGAMPGYRGEPARSRLFRNDGSGTFVDVTARAGVTSPAYGCGGAVADVDGDGDLDLYVTAFGPNLLFRNEGDGTFTEVGHQAGVADPLWSASAGFADVDRDGDLDLYVANYVDFSVEHNKDCGDKVKGIPGYCHPGAYAGLPDHFYRNRGDGTFVDATAKAGFAGATSAGLGVVFGDLDGDGWPDLYVANDADPNFLFHNRGDGTFEDVSLLSGTAYGDTGRPEAGMGVDVGDVDGDDRQDIVVTNFELETNALYKNAGGDLFTDDRFHAKIGEPSLLNLAFGVAFADLDADGDLDLVIANGHILDNAPAFNENSRYAQPNQVFENLGRGVFREVASGLETIVRVSRGLALGDLDGDGDLDVAINDSNQPAEVYENTTSPAGHWLLVDLVGARSNRGGIGSRLELTVDGRRELREARTASSYLSQNAASIHFGLGSATHADALEIAWPSGRHTLYRELPGDRRIAVYEGGERAAAAPPDEARREPSRAPHARDPGGFRNGS